MNKELEKNENKKDLGLILKEKSGRGLNVEKKQAVLGNNTEYTVTNQNGEQTDVKINDDNNNIEVRGAQKELKEMVEKGDLTNINSNPEKNNQVQQEAIAIINGSNLNSEEKQAEIANIQSQDFSKKPEGTHSEYLAEVRSKLKEKNNNSEDKGQEPNAMEQAFKDVMGGKSKEANEEERQRTPTTISPNILSAYMTKQSQNKK